MKVILSAVGVLILAAIPLFGQAGSREEMTANLDGSTAELLREIKSPCPKVCEYYSRQSAFLGGMHERFFQDGYFIGRYPGNGVVPNGL